MTRFFQWLGGGLFVASLAYWAGWYLVVLDRSSSAAGAGAPEAILSDAALFTLFAAHHSILARDAIKRKLAIRPDLIRSVYVWIASILLFVVCVSWRSIGGEMYHASGAAAAALVIVQLIGAWLIAQSVACIDALELAGIRPPRNSESSLQTSGPYRWVRHPLYLGWILVVFGAAHMTADRFAFAAISSIYLLVAVPWEERSLRQSFGNAYADYARSVRWRVIPYVY